MKRMILFLCFICFWIVVNPVLAKVKAPEVMKPIVYQGIRYETDYVNVDYGPKVNGGYVEAWDIKANKRLWRTRVYKIKKYNSRLEGDVQENFITNFELNKGHLNLRAGGLLYRIDLKTGNSRQVE